MIVDGSTGPLTINSRPSTRRAFRQRPNTKTIRMSDILNKATVLVLNRNWQAINVRTPAEAFCFEALAGRGGREGILQAGHHLLIACGVAHGVGLGHAQVCSVSKPIWCFVIPCSSPGYDPPGVIIIRVLHPQTFKYVLLEKFFIGLTRYFFEDRSQQNIA